MKIALCLSGYLRTFKECYSSLLENVIQDHDVDVFIHTYDKNGHAKDWTSPIDNSEDIDMEFLESIPYIKTMVIDKWDDINIKFLKCRTICMFYKIYKCNELKKQYEKENGFIYDLVIRARGDIYYPRKINLNFQNNKILLNSDGANWYEGDPNLHLNDTFAVGNSENMDYYCDLYNNIGYLIGYFEKIRNEMYCNMFSPEHILYKHLENKEIEQKKLFFFVKRKDNV